jgi:uncharacterized protein YyaL (SSP411 family)
MSQKYSNHLSGESSLYLQQHAHNPVNWYPWTDEAWAKAKSENKLVLVSIGYSSCHWCHVMERETFEDEATAKIMNENYICIKVDREERPDIDQVYMNAVQLMSGSGGWPLNCFTLPDGRPIYGGTYFPKPSWNEVLIKLKDFYKENPDQAKQYAGELTQGIRESELIHVKNSESAFTKDLLTKSIEGWKKFLDNVEGGPGRAPKFPLPGNYQLLLRYAVTSNDSGLLDHVKLTLDKMAMGGIYDQLAGGFSRYSTDSLWKVPHFEKMLYDNAQLISLYSSAYKLTKNELYKKIASETIDFLRDEMSDGNGGYFSAIDADSEGEEGKYYVWTKEEIKNSKLPSCGHANAFDVFSDYFSMDESGYWEKNNYILLRKKTDEVIAKKHNVTVQELNEFIRLAKIVLLKKRNERFPPALDKKIITSWNALQISALCNAYQAFGIEEYKSEAIRCAEHILKNSVNEDGKILHLSTQKNKMKAGYLEDYAFMISALINLYQVTFNESWLLKAREFTEDAIRLYQDNENGFFWFNANNNIPLIVNKKETTDNVIPSSNSEMANALFLLSDFFDEKKYSGIATRMLSSVEDSILKYPSSFSNWANLFMNYSYSFNEIVISGQQMDEQRIKLSAHYLPNAIFAGSAMIKSNIPLLENRFQEGKTLIYVCRNKTCSLPVQDPSHAIPLLNLNAHNHSGNVNYSK